MVADIDMRLPRSVQEIADLIGRERALYLVGNLPRSVGKNRYGQRIWLYVPKRLKPDHQLVRILGWHDAQKIVQEFGGIILELSTCRHVYSQFVAKSILRMAEQRTEPKIIAQVFSLPLKKVRMVLSARENPSANYESILPWSQLSLEI